MKNSSKSLDVFDFKEEDELTEATAKRVTAKLGDRFTFGDHDSGGTEMLSKTITAVIRGDRDAGNMGYDRNAAGSFSHLETECRSTLNHVLRFKFEQSTETKSNVPESGNINCGVECGSAPACLEDQSNCVFPEHSYNGNSVRLPSDADGGVSEGSLSPIADNSDADRSVSEGSLSPIADNSDSSDGPSSEKYFSGLDMDEDSGGIIFYPDYIDYSGAHYIDSVVSFSRNSVEVSNRNFEENDGTSDIHLEIDDIVKIESQWSARNETGTIKVYFISKDAVRNDIVYNASGIQEFRFAAIDSNWHKKQEAIESLNIKYKALWDFLLDTGMEKSSALPEGKAWMLPRTYFPDFNKPFDEVIYPKGDPDAVSISKRDIDLLRPDTFVNDTIIDFYIKYLKTKLNEEERVKFYFFNSFFFRKLADMDKDPNSAQDAQAAFLRVRKWTKKVNFLEKDFIFIPVNYNYHWSLIVICYFGEAASYEDVDRDKSVRVPCILHMDSMKGIHDGLKDLMQSYLWEEWKERRTEMCEDLYSKFRNMKFVSLELPQQQNSYDCGLFLLHYVELFLEDVPTNFNIHKLTSFTNFLQADWFPPADASLKRAHIERLISDLLDTHSEVRSSSDGSSDLHCSPYDPNKTNEDYENGFELLEETSALTNGYHDSSVCPEVGQGIEMTLLQASSVRASTQCTTSSGFVLKELFEPGSASQPFSDATWLDFERKESITELKRLDSIIEENVEEASECYIKTELLEPPSLQHLDGTLTGEISFPCSSQELITKPPHFDASNKPDASPTRSDSDDDASDTEANGTCHSTEDVELEKPNKCMSSELTDHLTVSLEPASVNVLNDAEFVAKREGNDSTNMPVLFEEPNESKSESDEQRTPKRMRIEPHGSL